MGDGSRAVAVMGALAKQGIATRYFGMDQFELAGGEVSLRDFHRTMRGAGIRPQLFPEPVQSGLIRFLHTIGSVDLVLIAEPAEIEQDARTQQLLSRISHPKTTILVRKDDHWVERVPSPSVIRRAA